MLALVACGSPTQPPAILPPGQWGGEGIGLVVTASDVFVEYDCSGGHIAAPLRLDPSGAFDVTGTFTNGGNIAGLVIRTRPARYVGHASASEVTVSMTLLDTVVAEPPAALTARFGAAPQIVAC